MPHDGYNLEGMILCIDYLCLQDHRVSPFPFSIQVRNNTKDIIQHYNKYSVTTSNEKKQWRDIVPILVPGDKVEVIVVFGLGFFVKKTTLYLIYGQLVDKEMEDLSTSNENVVGSTDASDVSKETMKVNLERIHLDDDEEEDALFKIAKRQ